MGDAGNILRLPGNLDPSAQEFRPRFHSHIPFYASPPPPQVFYPTTPPFPALQNDVQVMPFPFVDTSTIIPSVPPPSTRTLVLTMVPFDVSESTIRRELEVFGEVRGVQMERVSDGIVTVHFYDLRHAERALKEILEQHVQQESRIRNNHYSLMMIPNQQQNSCDVVTNFMVPPLAWMARGLICGRAVWAQFVIPATNAVPDGCNQGTIVVFNLGSGVSSASLRQIFAAFGDVKELRETPMKKRQRFVEFYDIRDAAKALKEKNGKDFFGRQVVIEFSRPGGYGRKFLNVETLYLNLPLTGPSNFHRSEFTTPPSPPPSSPPMHKFSVAPRSPSKANMKKSSSFNKSRSNCNGSGEISLDRVSLSDSGGNESVKRVGNGVSISKNGAKKCKSHSRKSLKQQLSKSNWSSKSRQMKKLDARFLINEDSMVESSSNSETRTTVMIKNIPNKYSQKLLLSMLDNHCIHMNEQNRNDPDQPLSAYDFVYLPIDFNNKCNVGYGFVNMTSAEGAWRLYKAFHHQHWEVFNSRKICEVTYARVQGLEALKEHFKNSKFPCEMDHYLPVVFSPPRDGKQQLTEPQPIVAAANSSSINSSSDGCDDDDDGDLVN